MVYETKGRIKKCCNCVEDCSLKHTRHEYMCDWAERPYTLDLPLVNGIKLKAVDR